MPLSPVRNKPKATANKTRNHSSHNSSRSDVRHIGSSIVPDTRCKGVQVSLTLEENKIPKTNLNNEYNFSRQIAIDNQENYINSYNKIRSDTVNFDQLAKKQFHDFYNGQVDKLNVCCQSKTGDSDDNSYVNCKTQTNAHKSDFFIAKNDTFPHRKHGTNNKERFIRQSETLESATLRSAGSSRGHINIYRNPTDYRSSLRLPVANSRGIPSNTIDKTQEFTNMQNLNQIPNQSSKFNFNTQSCCDRNVPQNISDHQPNAFVIKNKAPTLDTGLHEAPTSLKSKPKAIQTEKIRVQNPGFEKEYACENNKSVFPPHRNEFSNEKQNLFAENVSRESTPGKGCCSDGAGGWKTNFKPMPKSSNTNVHCACNSENEISYNRYEKLWTKKTCDREAGTISCASVSCTANQESKCRCRYPPFFKQYSCAGNINGCCTCND